MLRPQLKISQKLSSKSRKLVIILLPDGKCVVKYMFLDALNLIS